MYAYRDALSPPSGPCAPSKADLEAHTAYLRSTQPKLKENGMFTCRKSHASSISGNQTAHV